VASSASRRRSRCISFKGGVDDMKKIQLGQIIALLPMILACLRPQLRLTPSNVQMV